MLIAPWAGDAVSRGRQRFHISATSLEPFQPEGKRFCHTPANRAPLWRGSASVVHGKRLDNHESLSVRKVVRDGQMDAGAVAGRQHRRQPFPCPVGQDHRRLAARQVDNAHVPPEDAVGKPGPERLGAGFLGGKTLGVGGRAVLPAIGFCTLDISETAMGETLAKALDRFFDAADVDQVAA
ncbi:hypothetical protein AT6N2_C1325 [Agrobacterium tumefaciens]|nr:hypothetical protein AT6N2_C1325 [Agrobacterium tumefaciens]